MISDQIALHSVQLPLLRSEIEDRKSCEYRLSSILINFHRLYPLSMVISDTFALGISN